LRLKAYVIQSAFELPRLNGIYEADDFAEVLAARTRYLHFLFSQALQTSVHANWNSMAQAILIHAKEMRFSLQVSKMELSVLLNNQNYELMNHLIQYGAFFDRNERSIEAERMNKAAAQKDPFGKQEDDQATISDNQNIWLQQTSMRKNDYAHSLTALSSKAPFRANSAASLDNYSRALSNLDHTMQSRANLQE